MPDTFETERILGIASRFALGGAPARVVRLTAGNVNATYRLDMGEDDAAPRYILQRVNTVAFRDPDALMANIRLVTAHIREGLLREGVDPDRRVLQFIETDEGSLLYRAPDGGCFRAYRYIGGATAHNQAGSADLLREAGRGFGEFQRRLSDFPADRLVETIPHFHDTPRRFEALRAAVSEDRAHRVREVGEEIGFFDARRGLMRGITDRLASGELPLRVTHNDTKLNNVLLDDATGQAICVIDLDTVMPGSALYDYGDAVRYGASTAAEDEPDPSRIDLDLTLFRAFTEGFVAMTAGSLTEAELRLLPLGAEVMACELAMRFLTDYLNGDVYFKTDYAAHNLVRARAQIRLLCRMEERRDAMRGVVSELARRPRTIASGS